MHWQRVIECLAAGLFFANAVPHFVAGISGDSFPTPFARPPGKGLSSPTVNVLWALANLIAASLLFRAGRVASGGVPAWGFFFAGLAATSLFGSVYFTGKHAE